VLTCIAFTLTWDRDLEEADAEANKSTITELALRYSLVTPFTSFVASADNDDATMETMRRVDVGDAVTSLIAARSASPMQQIQLQLDQVKDVMAMNIGNCTTRHRRRVILTTPRYTNRPNACARRITGYFGRAN
jgi:hypothetical protein